MGGGLMALLIFLLGWGGVITHTDLLTDVAAAMVAPVPATVDVRCEPAENAFQFAWRMASDEVVDPLAVEAELRAVAGGVNYLFWRDSEDGRAPLLPAWRVDEDCRLAVLFLGPAEELPRLAHTNTKLIVVEDARDYCGKAIVHVDERAAPDNGNNNSSFLWVARACLNAVVVAHEMLHSMGAVQLGAPGSDGNWHTGTALDVMSSHSVWRCGLIVIDCGRDDYFSERPQGYLLDHWNSADSVYLVRVPRRLTFVPIYLVDGLP